MTAAWRGPLGPTVYINRNRNGGEAGSTWELSGDSLTLSEHVGHTVSAHGVVSHANLYNMKEDTKVAAVASGVKQNDAEHGHLTVTSFKMVGKSSGG